MNGKRPAAMPRIAQRQPAARFAADVQYYLNLNPRQLPSRYLYDALGSALFEAICRLPWYRITRAEERLLATEGADILRKVPSLSTVVELGSGSGEKLRILLERSGPRTTPLDVHLVDVSSSALEASARALETLTGIRITTHQRPYEDGLRDVRQGPGRGGRTLVVFLGSNIGNYDPPGANAFVRGVRGELRPGDALLLGADLVKPERELLLAYDDPLGVTAAFNRNLLVRINRELGGNFDVGAFAHEAIWNAAASRIEMHLVARSRQQIKVDEAQLAFTMEPGENIWTESSYKYQLEDIERLAGPAGFSLTDQWVDAEDRFALSLLEAR
jgi:dimethylhistidine N-methyltransferase